MNELKLSVLFATKWQHKQLTPNVCRGTLKMDSA